MKTGNLYLPRKLYWVGQYNAHAAFCTPFSTINLLSVLKIKRYEHKLHARAFISPKNKQLLINVDNGNFDNTVDLLDGALYTQFVVIADMHNDSVLDIVIGNDS
jgi:hypothetical protein